MEEIRVLLADDNDELRKAMREALTRKGGMRIVGEARDGEEALNFLSHGQTVDVMLLDIIMPRLDGYAVLSQMSAMELAHPPKTIVLTALGRDDFVARALRLGASYYMVKPVELDALHTRITELYSGALTERVITPLFPPEVKTLEEEIANIFLLIGVPANIKGYPYLREAVRLVIARPELISAITKELYPSVARKYAVTSSKVERAIRHAIEVAWDRGRIETFNRVFGCQLVLSDMRPTNGELIALVADKMRSRQRAGGPDEHSA